MTQKIFFTLSLISMLCLSACGTVRGIGQDLESAGRTVQDTVN